MLFVASSVLLALNTLAEMDPRQSRVVGRLKGHEQRRMMVNTGGVLLSKTLDMGNQVFLAMQARGFRGEVRLLTDGALYVRARCGNQAGVARTTRLMVLTAARRALRSPACQAGRRY